MGNETDEAGQKDDTITAEVYDASKDGFVRATETELRRALRTIEDEKYRRSDTTPVVLTLQARDVRILRRILQNEVTIPQAVRSRWGTDTSLWQESMIRMVRSIPLVAV